MRKIIILILLLILVTGCTRIDTTTDYKKLFQSVIANNTPVNTATIGYKYYLPIGVSVQKDLEFNQELKVMNTTMYLYVDVVSYHFKNFTNYQETKHNYDYFEQVGDGTNYGFVAIKKEEDKHFVKVVYNYGIIEAYVDETELSKIISYSALILNSIKYNDVMIEKIINDNNITSNETLYNIKKPSDSESKFSQYLQEFVQEENQIVELPDE